MPHPVDVHVGKRIRHRRWLVGKTQQELASEVGVKFQQVQKYETGANRVSASRLWEIAAALDVDVTHFFEGLNSAESTSGEKHLSADVVQAKEAVDLVRTFFSIPEEQRAQLSSLAKVLAV
ncbi:helix-turn-helix domain-containing protein [Leisingera aquaemixtae]|uniref:helix-turn-helix domain-containing protein n=1 Tax=Leisingera aquaemixtae TaxID=1396826 RepID=UPI001C976F96|nr:helix-turn-helix transcriptional regulator [Leisingera aquaemixtae]MBY6068419.1 helix-turn-helix domain-containing protein [Leisingera aquaemixtae]